jgi:prepilin-type N-terminal cleavage/methylation domain-containing protein
MPRGRGGFTLVELLVALTISSMLAAVIFMMMSGQSRIVAVQSAKEEAQQNVRGALEVLSSELRGAVPQGITAADAQSLTFMQPRMWGIVCPQFDGSEPAGNTLTALFPTTGTIMPTASQATGVMVNTGNNLAQPNWAPVPPARAVLGGIQVVGGPTAPGCSLLGASGNLQAIQITAPNIGDLSVSRSNVMIYTMTQYDVAEVSGTWWLRRSNGMDANGDFETPQPLAGPVEADKVGFTYFAADPDVEVATPVAAPEALRMVRIQVVTNSAQTVNGRAQRDSGAVTVMLRNN